jgi:hypothetical protein
VDVSPDVALRLAEHATCADLRLTLVKGADHRFSARPELALIAASIDDMVGHFGNGTKTGGRLIRSRARPPGRDPDRGATPIR